MMEWLQVVVLLAGNVGIMLAIIIPMFLWLRSEANADRRESAALSASDRRDILQLIRNIQDEMKDFHGKLCSIEERGKK